MRGPLAGPGDAAGGEQLVDDPVVASGAEPTVQGGLDAAEQCGPGAVRWGRRGGGQRERVGVEAGQPADGPPHGRTRVGVIGRWRYDVHPPGVSERGRPASQDLVQCLCRPEARLLVEPGP